MMLPRILGESSPAAETELAAEQTVRITRRPATPGQPQRPEEEATAVMQSGAPAPALAPAEAEAEAVAEEPTMTGTAAGSSAVMAIGSLVSRGTGFLRTVMLSAALGGVLLGLGDAYTTAQFFPGMVYELLIGGVLASVVVPVLVRARDRDADGGEAYAQRLLTLAMVVLGAAAALATLAAPILTMIYTNTETGEPYRDLVTTLSYFTLPAIFFFGVSAILAAYLNTRGVFGPPMWTPILNNVIVIVTCGLFLGLFGAVARKAEDVSPSMILLLGGGTLLGITIQTAGLVPALRRAGFRWRFRFDFRELGLRNLAHLGGWMFCYVAVSQIGVLVMLRLLSGKGLLIYNNVFLLMMMAHGIVAVSIITALLPRMSAAAAAALLNRFCVVRDPSTCSTMPGSCLAAFVGFGAGGGSDGACGSPCG
jgi:putative peptidoglycan lipid II flippase